ncbi:MAG: hypothetical protein ACOC2N_01655 [Spirochaetota bacterium]
MAINRSKVSMSHVKANVSKHLRGRTVVYCQSEHLGPADDGRALAGLETGLITRFVSWYEIDGVPVSALTVAELRRVGLLRV